MTTGHDTQLAPPPQTLQVLRLKVLVPLAILLCAATFGLVNLHISTREAERRVEADAQRALAQRMVEIQDELEFLLTRGELERAREDVAALGADPNVSNGVLLGPEGTVLAATRRERIGMMGVKELQALRQSAKSPDMPRGPATRFSDDRMHLLAYGPVTWNTHPWAPNQSQTATMILELDLSRLKQAARQQVWQVLLPQSLLLGGLAGALWLVFHFALTRRVRALVTAAEQFGRGDWNARAAVGGRDELALVAHAFDQAAASVRAAQQALLEREADLRHLLESTAEGIVGLDRDGRCTFCNPAAARLLGYRSPKDLLGKHEHAMWHHSRPDGAPFPREDCPLLRSVRGGSPAHLDHGVFWRANGRRFDVEAWAHPLFRDGRPEGAVLTFIDITVRKRAEDAQHFLLQATEQLAQSLDADGTLRSLAHLAIPFLADWCVVDVVEPTGAIRRAASAHVDPAREPLLETLQQRYPPGWHTLQLTSQVLTSGATQLIPEVDPSSLEAYVGDADQTRLLQELGLRSAMAVPIRIRGEIRGALFMACERRGQSYGTYELGLAEELARHAAVAIDNARLYQQAQAAVRLRDEFLSIASHELHTPLTPLQLQLQLIRRSIVEGRCGDLSKLERNLAIALRQVHRLSRLVDDLLDVSRIVGGRLTLHLERLELVEVTREVLERFAEQAREAGSTLRLHAPAPVVGAWDRLRIEQVLTNLLSNALKYGRGKPIDIKVRDVDGWAEWRIRDRGIGIAEENVERIFGRFERAVSTRAFGGLGLGLYITQQIVAAHGGSIRVQSRPGEGATFTTRLPLQPAEHPAEEPPGNAHFSSELQTDIWESTHT